MCALNKDPQHTENLCYSTCPDYGITIMCNRDYGHDPPHEHYGKDLSFTISWGERREDVVQRMLGGGGRRKKQ